MQCSVQFRRRDTSVRRERCHVGVVYSSGVQFVCHVHSACVVFTFSSSSSRLSTLYIECRYLSSNSRSMWLSIYHVVIIAVCVCVHLCMCG